MHNVNNHERHAGQKGPTIYLPYMVVVVVVVVGYGRILNDSITAKFLLNFIAKEF